MMQCRQKDTDAEQGDLLDIRETQRVDYTLMNMQRDDWMIADGTNCPVLGGEATFTFSDAIRYLKRGLKVSRQGWNGKGMYLFLGYDIHVTTDAVMEEYAEKLEDGTYNAEMQDAICMRTADKSISVGWTPTQMDILATDWKIFES